MMEKDRSKEPRSIGVTVDELLDAALLDAALAQGQRVRFSNPDIDYLTRRSQLKATTVGRFLRIFGEPVVLEALRRIEPGWNEHIMYGICRNVERGLA